MTCSTCLTLCDFLASIRSSWAQFVRLLFTPVDGSSLAFNRIVVGILLLLDIINERGLSRADLVWSTDEKHSLDSFQCRFPLFESITRLNTAEGMYAVYLVMVVGIIGVILGSEYRLSCLIYSSSYWYLLLIEKSRWNNHSYLFGLFSLMNLTNDSHCKWSYDSRNGRLSGNVPFWQYFVFRFQIFLVYFYAGVKKTNLDWLRGYSMVSLSSHWLWWPWTHLVGVPEHWIDYLVIHLGGFVFDCSVGFMFLFRCTRPLAFLLCSFFNLANSQMFQIGMFPWIMLAVMPLFCDPDWPVWLANKAKSICTCALLPFYVESEQNEINKDQTMEIPDNSEIQHPENLIERLRIYEDETTDNSSSPNFSDSITYRKIPSRIPSSTESSSKNFLSVPQISTTSATSPQIRKRHLSEVRKLYGIDLTAESENFKILPKIPETSNSGTFQEFFNLKSRIRSKNLTKLFGIELKSYFYNCTKPAISVDQSKLPEFALKNNFNESSLGLKNGLILCTLIVYIGVQVALPFAHPALPGYNTWTNGMYGYSWDMMVHNWNHLHTRVTLNALTNETNQPVTFYLNPDSWTLNARWSHHADMAVQFAKCVDRKLRAHFAIRDVQLYLDVWTSLNGRFTQRMYDPNRDILSVDWSPFKQSNWVLPILGDSEKWRAKLEAMDREIADTFPEAEESFLVYIADFPGMPMSNYIDDSLFTDDPTLIMLQGLIRVSFHNGTEYFLSEARDRVRLARGMLVTVTVFGGRPGYYAILYPKLNNATQIMPKSIDNISAIEHIRQRNSLQSR